MTDEKKNLMKTDALGNVSLALGETAAHALAAQVEAEVKARFAMAQYRPRNMDQARVELLGACKKPSFAALKTAVYKIPRWDREQQKEILIPGPGVALADEAVKLFGNIATDTTVVYDDENMRIIQVRATDLETNLTKTGTVTIRKIVERHKVPKGKEVLGSRVTADGKKVYYIRPADNDLWATEQAAVAKMRRNLELQLIPRDVIDEAVETILATRENQAAQDPEGEKRKVLDAFARIGVKPIELERYLGHSLDTISPSEINDLRGIYGAIVAEETTWAAVMESIEATDEEPEKEPPSKTTDRVMAALKKKRGRKPKKAEPASEPEPEPKPEPTSEPPPKPEKKVTVEKRTKPAPAPEPDEQAEVRRIRAKVEAMAAQLPDAMKALNEAAEKVMGKGKTWQDAQDYDSVFEIGSVLSEVTE